MWITMLDLHTAVILTGVKSSVMGSLTIILLLLFTMQVTCYADDTQLYLSAKQNRLLKLSTETWSLLMMSLHMLNSIQTKPNFF